jgi:hypothetical protein
MEGPLREIAEAQVCNIEGRGKLRLTFVGGGQVDIPMTEQVGMVLNAGGWLAREYIARVFESDLDSANVVSRRIRKIEL